MSSRARKTLADIKGRKINMVELSVSHYLLARGLSTVKLKEKDVKVVNTSDADIVAAFKSKDSTAVVTWNPQLLEVKAEPGSTSVFELEQDPRRNSGPARDQQRDAEGQSQSRQGAGRHLVRDHRADEETRRDKGKAAREAMAKLSGTDLAGFEAQLKTTFMYYTPAEAAAFMNSPDMPKIMDLVRTFCFEHNLLGEKVKSKDAVGIQMPKATLGSSKNIKLRFDPSYMAMAADGKL